MRVSAKKGILIALCLLLVVSVVGISCGSKPAGPPTPTFTAARGATPTPLPSPTPAPVKAIKLKASSYGGPTYSQRMVFERAMETIKKNSGGRLEFDYFPGSSLLQLTDTFEAVRTNVVQIAVSTSTYERDRMGIIYEANAQIFSWAPDKFNQHFRDPGGFYERAEGFWNKWDMHLLAHPRVPYGEILSRKPVRKMEDFNGLIIRTVTGLAPALKLLGATPVFTSLEELYEALQRGTVDAQGTTVQDMVSSKRYEVAKYVIVPHLYSGSLDHIINLSFYKSLPPDLQKVIDDAFIEAQNWWNSIMFKDYDDSIAALKKAGVDVYEVPQDELARWNKQIQPYWDDLAKKYPADWGWFNKLRLEQS